MPRVSSTAKGNLLEQKIYDFLDNEIGQGKFWAKPECCKIFRKKGYYSRDRKKKIIFDVSIEIFLPGSIEYSILVLIECKNSGRPISVEDAEEFFSKIEQVASANGKGILAATNSFQEGTVTYSSSKGIALLRYFDESNLQWELNRSLSVTMTSISEKEESEIYDGLTKEEYTSSAFNLFGIHEGKATHSFKELAKKLAYTSSLKKEDIEKIANTEVELKGRVKFLQKSEIEDIISDLLMSTGYQKGAVSLETICEKERSNNALELLIKEPSDLEKKDGILGRISFNPTIIQIYTQEREYLGRERFTLAHELGHHVLGHASYMKREYSKERDLTFDLNNPVSAHDIKKMEWQAKIILHHVCFCLKAS